MKTGRLLIMVASFIAGMTFVYSCGGGTGTTSEAAVIQIEPSSIYYDMLVTNVTKRPMGTEGRNSIITTVIFNTTQVGSGLEVLDEADNVVYRLNTFGSQFQVNFQDNAGIPLPIGYKVRATNSDGLNLSGYTY